MRHSACLFLAVSILFKGQLSCLLLNELSLFGFLVFHSYHASQWQSGHIVSCFSEAVLQGHMSQTIQQEMAFQSRVTWCPMSGYSRGTNFAFSCILNLPGGRHCVLFTSLCSVSHIAPDTHWVSTNVVRLQNRELPTHTGSTPM